MILPEGCVWKRANGLAQELPEEEDLTTEHVMAIGSVTKPFTSATILLMMEDGLLSLDDPLSSNVFSAILTLLAFAVCQSTIPLITESLKV